MKPSLVVLAAGVGSRYGGLKQIDKLGPTGETIIDYSVYDAYKAGFGKVVFVIRKSIEADFKEAIADKYSGKIEVDYVLQEIDKTPYSFDTSHRQKPWGTGHAVLMAAEKVNENFAVINGDDFYGADAFLKMKDFLEKNSGKKGKFSMVGYYLKNTLSENGFVSRGLCQVDENGILTDVTELTKIQEVNGEIIFEDKDGNSKNLERNSLVSMNFWGFTPDLFANLKELFIEFLKENAQSEKAEFYIPFAVNDLIKANKASAKVLSTTASWFGVTYREDREMVVNNLKELHDNKVYPSPLW
ncbi:MAG: sugar phosphate nucleotidyltransferase [Bacteroidales bacterium]|nr:sugar phosphate nucleotidyltransferase [Bacteroidales bacterium]MDY0216060.1 sugar phosphate nucleotidyltransferase [Bacteroidales bacterium]